jgi:hypothetical protein
LTDIPVQRSTGSCCRQYRLRFFPHASKPHPPGLVKGRNECPISLTFFVRSLPILFSTSLNLSTTNLATTQHLVFRPNNRPLAVLTFSASYSSARPCDRFIQPPQVYSTTFLPLIICYLILSLNAFAISRNSEPILYSINFLTLRTSNSLERSPPRNCLTVVASKTPTLLARGKAHRKSDTL